MAAASEKKWTKYFAVEILLLFRNFFFPGTSMDIHERDLNPYSPLTLITIPDRPKLSMQEVCYHQNSSNCFLGG